jgi:hypothetical protein
MKNVFKFYEYIVENTNLVNRIISKTNIENLNTILDDNITVENILEYSIKFDELDYFKYAIENKADVNILIDNEYILSLIFDKDDEYFDILIRCYLTEIHLKQNYYKYLNNIDKFKKIYQKGLKLDEYDIQKIYENDYYDIIVFLLDNIKDKTLFSQTYYKSLKDNNSKYFELFNKYKIELESDDISDDNRIIVSLAKNKTLDAFEHLIFDLEFGKKLSKADFNRFENNIIKYLCSYNFQDIFMEKFYENYISLEDIMIPSIKKKYETKMKIADYGF